MRHELIHSLIGTARCNTSVKRMKFAYNVWTHHLSGKTDHEKTINTMSPPTAPFPFDSMGDLLPQMPARNLSFLIVVIPSPNKAFLFKKPFTPLSAIHSVLSLDEVSCFVPQPSLSSILSILTWLCLAFCNVHRAQQSHRPCVQSQASPTRVQGPTAVDVWRTLLPHSEQESTLELLS